MKISTDGIVIWELKTGEADRVVTILTDNGVLTAYARGSLRPNNKLTSPTAMLGFSNFELRSGKNMYNIEEALSIRRFLSLASDAKRYALAVYFCELLKLLAPIEDNAGDFMSLILNSLFLLNEGKKEILLIKTVFELRVMTLAGYMPDLLSCADCGAHDANPGSFDISNGIWYCEKCAVNWGEQKNISLPVLSAMRHIIYSDSDKSFSFSLSGKSLNNLSNITTRFVICHIEHRPITLGFFLDIMDTI